MAVFFNLYLESFCLVCTCAFATAIECGFNVAKKRDFQRLSLLATANTVLSFGRAGQGDDATPSCYTESTVPNFFLAI